MLCKLISKSRRFTEK